MGTNYAHFIQEYLDFFQEGDTIKESVESDRKDYCYDCRDEGYWVMMALRCRKCDKILLGGL